MDAAVESLRQLIRPRAAGEVAFDPNFSYLRVTARGRTGYAWRGSIENSPAGPIEVFYSGTGEVVRLLNGRLAGAVGFPTEWRKVSLRPPSWSDLASSAKRSVAYERTRDVMPGYHSGIRETISVRTIVPPDRTALRVLEPSKLAWFEESMQNGNDPLPPARYAVQFENGQETVVYSEQCLARDLCFTFQRWSSAMQQALQAASAQAK